MVIRNPDNWAICISKYLGEKKSGICGILNQLTDSFTKCEPDTYLTWKLMSHDSWNVIENVWSKPSNIVKDLFGYLENDL